MQYKYTIIQEEKTSKSKLTYEFSANDEDDLVQELNCFIRSIGYTESGYLTLVNEDDALYDDLDSEVEQSDKSRNPEVEDFMNFEFTEGQGQTEYTFTSSDADKIADKSESIASTWPFPLDRPSDQTYRVDSMYETNGKGYYGA